MASDAVHLVKLNETVNNIESKVSEYEKLVNETVQRHHEIAENRKVLDTAAAEYMQSCYLFLKQQNETLETEIFAEFEPVQLTERLKKITMINEVIDLGNNTKIANFKSQA